MCSQTRLFVGNLPENLNDAELRKAFSKFGEVDNLDLKSNDNDANKKNFAFITLSASTFDVETCIRHFSTNKFKGSTLYVTRARESFLERLKREREQAQKNIVEQAVTSEPIIPYKNAPIKLSESLNPRKRRGDNKVDVNDINKHAKIISSVVEKHDKQIPIKVSAADQKKLDSDKKRMESMKKKRQEFKEKQMIIKSCLGGVDKITNTKVIFSDDDEPNLKKNKTNINITSLAHANNTPKNNISLFDEDDESDNEVNFEIKEQFEGKKGQKVLELQSRYKSDKRFVLDKRFVEDVNEEGNKEEDRNEHIDVGQADEKIKQLNILQNVLGVSIKSAATEHIGLRENKKTKVKMGMLRYDPAQPDHMKFLASGSNEIIKSDDSKSKKKKHKTEKTEETPKEPEGPKIEVSKEQFYKVSETLKDAMAQPNAFSLRSLFAKGDEKEENKEEQDDNYIPLEKKKEQRFKNPLEPNEKNPFQYDSSDSEVEDNEHNGTETIQDKPESKAVWTENLFFTESDMRLKEGLSFFNKANETEVTKDRRELKSLMKKRIYNKERKIQMFQKKIGGRKKVMKKTYNNKRKR